MHRQILTNRQSEAGVTLLEAMLQLLLFLVFCQLIGLIFLTIDELSDAKTKRMEVDWEIAMTDLSHYLVNARAKVGDEGDEILFKSDTTDTVRRIRYVNGAFALIEKGGFETLLTHIKKGKFTIEAHELVVEAVLESGETKSRRFIVRPFDE